MDNDAWTSSSGGRWSRGRAGFAALGLAALVITLGHAGAARAQGTDGFDYSRFEPQPTQGYDLLNVSTSALLGHLRFGAGLFFTFEDDPLTVVQNADHSAIVSRAVDQRLLGELSVAFGLFGRFSLGLAMPVALTEGGDDLAFFGRTGHKIAGTAPGDLRVVPKVLILDPADFGGFGLHIAAPIHIPTGDQDSFLSDGGVGVTPTLGLDYRTDGGVVVALNAGFRLRPKRVAYNYVSDDAIEWGVGLEVPIVEPLAVLGTAFGAIDTAKSKDPVDFTKDSTDTGVTVEGVLALQLDLGVGLALTAGAGGAIVRGVGSPDVRAFLGLDWSSGRGPQDTDGDGILDPDDKCPEQAEDVDGFEDHDGCPDLDNDGDGIPDNADGCPNDPEDKDGFEDQDGCPDPDNDGDGVADALDKCPTEKEDKDGFQDDDGCPDPDNDGDGIPDAADKCPDQAEDKDGLADDDGCPETDADGDGVPDETDKCPDRPETKNGFQDEDGCPDTKSKDVEVTAQAIRIKKSVYFARGLDTILPNSFTILDSVAEVLRDNAFITKVRVEGNTDSEGPDDLNLELSQRRAESVIAYLVTKGVTADRLEAKGYGETQPIATNATPLGRAKNRRVEFKILSVYGTPVATPADVDSSK